MSFCTVYRLKCCMHSKDRIFGTLFDGYGTTCRTWCWFLRDWGIKGWYEYSLLPVDRTGIVNNQVARSHSTKPRSIFTISIRELAIGLLIYVTVLRDVKYRSAKSWNNRFNLSSALLLNHCFECDTHHMSSISTLYVVKNLLATVWGLRLWQKLSHVSFRLSHYLHWLYDHKGTVPESALISWGTLLHCRTDSNCSYQHHRLSACLVLRSCCWPVTVSHKCCNL